MTMPDTGMEGPTNVRVHSGGIELCYWKHGTCHWIRSTSADMSWREYLDLPASLAAGVTIGTFISLFEIADHELDERLFSACTSIPMGPFSRWIRALAEPGFPPLPDHFVAAELEAPIGRTADGRIQGMHPLVVHLISEGAVDDSFWGDTTVFPWATHHFPLAQLKDVPLRFGVKGGKSNIEVLWPTLFSFRQIIQAVFFSCSPANRSSDLLPSDRVARLGGTVTECTESLEEMLGVPLKGHGHVG